MISKFTFCLTFIIFCSFNISKSQDTLKPFTNKWGTELNINPLNGSFSLNNANGQIKIRKFSMNNTALRLAFTLGYKQDLSKTDDPYGALPVNVKNNCKSTTVTVNLGQEKHFQGSGRISPYIGYEAAIGAKFSTEKTTNAQSKRTVKGAWEQYGSGYPSYRVYSERGFWSLGINAVTGIDFYIVKNFYAGCEVAFGLDYIRYSNIEIDDASDTSSYPDLKESGWKIGPKLLNGIRIGYIF